MKVAVLVKLVPDTEATLRIDEGRQRIATADLNMVLNPYDEFAVEEALRINEAKGGVVVLFSFGGEESLKALRQGLAMGADEAVQVVTTGGVDMQGVAQGLAEALRSDTWDIILAGKQAVDDDCAAIGPMVAEFLGLPHVSTVVKLEIGEGKAIAHREVEGGIEVMECTLPALFTAQKGLNEPRYASLKGIMMAKKKEIKVVSVSPPQPTVRIVQLQYPPMRPPGKIVGQGVEAVPELVRLLAEEARVI